MLIQLNMDDLHFNPDLWGKHDPQQFVPERYSYLVHLFNLSKNSYQCQMITTNSNKFCRIIIAS